MHGVPPAGGDGPPRVAARAGSGGVAIGVAHQVTISQLPPRPAARSAYLEQVRRIAPPELLDRESELAELARFCLEPDRGPYVWWQAGPWAGKSALLASFVTDPPAALAGRVWIVSFFITSRLAAQDTREAFTTALLGQLAALTGQDLPEVADPSAREAHLLHLLGQAAAACRANGGRLVLVLDGIDEDRSASAGAGVYTIAGLVPADPPAGMRIIVAGRSNPPIPDDVPDWHPLRDPGIRRLLGASPHAHDLRRLAQTELKRLLTGDRLGRDLVGLITAARGGLSGTDLRELTGAELYDIEAVLHTGAGRTFASRVTRWGTAGSAVYLLGHEELYAAAVRYLGPDRLGPDRLDEYRRALHDWADAYRVGASGGEPWPADTPEYLLLGYPRMLAAAGDTARLVALATDPARHDRMLARSGGDGAAFAELTAAQERLLSRPPLDFYSLARLSVQQQRLRSRNAFLPAELVAAWVRLGEPARAEALARGMSAQDRGGALAALARAFAATGEPDRAEQLAREITDQYWRERALRGLLRPMAAAGECDRAERIARELEQRHPQAMVELVAGVAAAGEFDRAERLIPDACAHGRGDALGELVPAMVAAGQPDRARRLVREAERAARRSHELAALVPAVAAIGDRDWARRLTDQAEQAARREPVDFQDEAFERLVRALAAIGEFDRAEQLLPEIFLLDRADARHALMNSAVAAGQLDRAARLATSYMSSRDTGVTLVEALAGAGEFELAERYANDIRSQGAQARALARLAEIAAAAGQRDRARRLAGDAERLARHGGRVRPSDPKLDAMVRALVAAGEPDRAAWLAGRYDGSPAPVAVVAAMVEAGAVARAQWLASGLTHPGQRVRALVELAGGLARGGEFARAEQLADGLAGPYDRAWLLARVARAAALAGEVDRARRLRRDAEREFGAVGSRLAPPVRSMGLRTSDWFDWLRAVEELIGAVAAAGEVGRAEQLVRDLAEIDQEPPGGFATVAGTSYAPGTALVALVGGLAAAGEFDQAERRAGGITYSPLRVEALTRLVPAVAAAGDAGRARRLAGEAERAAGEISSSDRRAEALTAIARAVGPPESERLLAQAFVIGPWWVPLPALAAIHPEPALRIVDEALLAGSAPGPDHGDG